MYRKDPISGYKTYIPDNWTFCKLFKIPSATYKNLITALNMIDSLNNIPKTTQVWVFGFPSLFNSNTLAFVAPESSQKDSVHLRKFIGKINELKCSTGKIEKIGEMIAISCSCITGMSGSPVFIENYGKLQVIGLLHGGPASLLQYCSFMINNNLEILSDQRIVNLLDVLRPLSLNHYSLIIEFLESFRKGEINTFDRKSFLDYSSILYKRALKIELSLGTSIKYNLVTPFTAFVNELMNYE